MSLYWFWFLLCGLLSLVISGLLWFVWRRPQHWNALVERELDSWRAWKLRESWILVGRKLFCGVWLRFGLIALLAINLAAMSGVVLGLLLR